MIHVSRVSLVVVITMFVQRIKVICLDNRPPTGQ